MKTALVTGASRGLGKEIARILTERGYVVLTPNRSKLQVGDVDSIEGWAERMQSSVDLLVNNAGIISDSVDESLLINALGPYHLMNLLWPKLVKTRGRVVNISSREGLMASFGNRPYSASKVLLNAFTRMKASNDDGVEVCACCPGWFRSGCGGDKAPISAAEAADTPIWLATEATDVNGKFFINREVVPW